MAINPEAAFSRGDLMRRLADQDRRIRALETARRLESASIGAGGLRLQGGRLLAEDLNGEKVFEVTTEPPDIFMRPELIASIAKEVLAASIFSAVNDGNQDVNYPSSGFVDPDSGTAGPTITDVEISDSGRALIQLDSAIFPNEPTSGAVSAQFGVSVSGATSLPANPEQAISMVQFAGVGTIACQCAGTILLTDLTPGLHTFTGKYLAEVVSGTPPAFARFNDPTITVTAF